MSWDISKMLLYFLDLTKAETWLAWLVIHLKEFDFFKLVLRLPTNGLCFFLLWLCLSVTIDWVLCLFIIIVRNYRLFLLKAR